MIADVRELLDPDLWVQARKGLIYELEEAPEGHGGLPRPRDCFADSIVVGNLLCDAEGEAFGVHRQAYRKEWREHWSLDDDKTTEVCIYQVWVPCEWNY